MLFRSLAASTLASATHAAGIATAAKPPSCRVRRIDIVTGGGRLANLVLVLAEGPIRQMLVTLDRVREEDELDALAQDLNRRLVGRSAEGVEHIGATLGADGAPVDPVLRTAIERVAAQMRETDASAVEDIYSEGLLNMLEAPEFARSEKLRQVFAVLQDRSYLGRLIPDLTRQPGVRVLIGHENGREEMAGVSLVIAPYGRPGRAIGMVGVVGPTRMAYPHAISTVRYVSSLMNELVDHLYADRKSTRLNSSYT